MEPPAAEMLASPPFMPLMCREKAVRRVPMRHQGDVGVHRFRFPALAQCLDFEADDFIGQPVIAAEHAQPGVDDDLPGVLGDLDIAPGDAPVVEHIRGKISLIG